MVLRLDKQRVLGQEEALALAIQDFVNVKDSDLKTLTDLDDNEIGVLSLLVVMSERLKIREIRDFVREFCRFRISRYRIGRREVRDVISYSGLVGGEDIRRRKGLKDMFAGFR